MTNAPFLAAALLAAALATLARADEPELLATHPAPDPRLVHVRSLHQGSGFKPYADKQQWLARAAYLREQVLIAAGLWPLPERCPLNADIHGLIDRTDYTVEKVFFQSYPGFYVTGNLYRPKGKTGPFPGVLCPHGHWADGRFQRISDKEVQQQIAGGFEKEESSARFVLQARCANLAKLGCVVFHYDMIGYADADPEHFPHRKTYLDTSSHLLGLSILGLQTWDSIRAADFLLSLPEVDPERLACTGASGGATQTIMLMAADQRLKFAAPVCMISAGDHQGGCVCENAALLRPFTDNVELAATFAPKPFIHPTATGDWTHEFMEHGYPEIRATYALFGAAADVEAVRYEAKHNYNLKNREAVYNFFNKHLRLGHESPVTEQHFDPVEPKDLSVFDAEHPRPANAVDAATLAKYVADAAAKQMESLKPTDAASLEKCRAVIGPALHHMLATTLPAAADVSGELVSVARNEHFEMEKLLLSRKGDEARVPAVLLRGGKPKGICTIIVTPEGKGAILNAKGDPTPLVAGLLGAGQHVLSPDVFQTGELRRASPATAPATAPAVEFFAGYNRTPLANRVHDILTTIAYARTRPGIKQVNLIGLGRAGVWCLLARSLAADALTRTAADADHFDFAQIQHDTDDEYLPCALRYGGLWPLAGIAAPSDLLIAHAPSPDWLRSTYRAAGAEQKLRTVDAMPTEVLLEWITQ